MNKLRRRKQRARKRVEFFEFMDAFGDWAAANSRPDGSRTVSLSLDAGGDLVTRVEEKIDGAYVTTECNSYTAHTSGTER